MTEPYVTVDTVPDANGHWTIRFADGTENGNTELQPIATVYNLSNAQLLAAALTSTRCVPFLKRD